MLYTTLETVRIATLLSQPVMPESTGKLLDLLGQPEDQRTFAAIGTRLAPGTALPAPVGVFPRYQVESSSTTSRSTASASRCRRPEPHSSAPS